MTTAIHKEEAGSASAVTASLYVGDLYPSVTEDILYEAFTKFKTLASIRLCKDASGRSLCYGYVNFLSCEYANLAISEKNDRLLEGKIIQVMWPVREPEARRTGVGNIFAENLDANVSEDLLREKLSEFGKIASLAIANDDNLDISTFLKGYVPFPEPTTHDL